MKWTPESGRPPLLLVVVALLLLLAAVLTGPALGSDREKGDEPDVEGDRRGPASRPDQTVLAGAKPLVVSVPAGGAT